ncbi:hypothetical protein I4U23_022005 [Adineta vaga]|nr:hypothetical protein I4U23_022005 [Adineta vaga]
MIDEFEQDYSNEYALWWYTRDTFLYRQLNKILRLQDIEWLFQFRFFIRHMYELLKQLQSEQQNCFVTNIVYRAQLISCEELVQLKNSIEGRICFVSFLSTTRDRQRALFLLGDNPTTCNDNLYPILFEIKTEDQINDTLKPFADITKMSAFDNDEQETLFMIGRIGSEDNLLTLGTLMRNSGRLDQAEKFYHRMLTEIQSEDHLVANCYQGLGLVAAAKGDLDNALMWQTKALEYYKQILPVGDYRIVCIYNSIGNIHWRNK